MLDVSFLNKNLYRRYPLRSSSTMVSQQGIEVPLTLIAGARISSVYGYHQLYISRLIVNGNHLNMTISNTSPAETVGYFSVDITQDYQTVKLTPVKDFTAGYIVFGQQNALSVLQGANTFIYDTSALEDSIITCVQAPIIKAIMVGENRITGVVKAEYDNIKETPSAGTLTLDVIDVNSVLSRTDIGTSRLNCPTLAIGGINNVTPTTDGNIDIYGILPVIIEITDTGIVATTPGLGFNEICANVKNNIPPVPAVSDSAKSLYIGDIITATAEEWKTWPQYNS